MSYLDIILLASITPAVFVAKSEVRSWPVFGWFARRSGTIFVERRRRAQAVEANDEIAAALKEGALVILFPEGTSSDGRTVLPFKSSLLEPASRHTHPLSVGLLRYGLDDGDPGEEICYWKDMTLAPHLVNLLSKKAPLAEIHFTRVQAGGADRKELAHRLRLETLHLQEKTRPARFRPVALIHS